MPRFQLDVCKNGLEKCPFDGKDFYIYFKFNLLIIIPVLKVRVCPRKYLWLITLFLCMFHDCCYIETFSLEGLTGICAVESMAVAVISCASFYLQICWIRSLTCIHSMNSLESEHILNLCSIIILSSFVHFFLFSCFSYLF